jgi:hypothetical protein
VAYGPAFNFYNLTRRAVVYVGISVSHFFSVIKKFRYVYGLVKSPLPTPVVNVVTAETPRHWYWGV